VFPSPPPAHPNHSRRFLRLAGLGWLSILAIVPLSGCGSLNARGLNAEGVRRFERAQYVDSLEKFQQALRNDPKNADSYYNLGAVHHRLATSQRSESDYRQAEAYYNQCLDRDMDHAECHRGLAVLLAEQGRVDEAFRLIEGWASRRTDLPEPKIELARLFEETGNLAGAKERLVEALAADPNHARARAALGNVQEKLGESQEALANYQRSLWYDRYQPEVAARIASLQASLPAATAATMTAGLDPPTTGNQPRVVSRGTGTLR